MRTYWATCLRGETVPPTTVLDGGLAIPLFVEKYDGEMAADSYQLEVAVVPAAALKRLVEACNISREYVVDEIERRMIAGESDTRLDLHRGYLAQIDSALSEWKGGAE